MSGSPADEPNTYMFAFGLKSDTINKFVFYAEDAARNITSKTLRFYYEGPRAKAAPLNDYPTAKPADMSSSFIGSWRFDSLNAIFIEIKHDNGVWTAVSGKGTVMGLRIDGQNGTLCFQLAEGGNQFQYEFQMDRLSGTMSGSRYTVGEGENREHYLYHYKLVRYY